MAIEHDSPSWRFDLNINLDISMEAEFTTKLETVDIQAIVQRFDATFGLISHAR